MKKSSVFSIFSRFCVVLVMLVSVACGSSVNDKGHAIHGQYGDLISKHGLFVAKIEWSAQPVAGEPVNEAELKFFDEDGESIEAELIGFHPLMPAHGHGANESTIRWTPDSGPAHEFQVSGVYFNMSAAAGQWVIKVVAAIDGVVDEMRVAIDHEVR